MSWQEKIRNLPINMLDKGWPSPETREFWKYAYYETEALPVIADQSVKVAKIDDLALLALATCYQKTHTNLQGDRNPSEIIGFLTTYPDRWLTTQSAVLLFGDFMVDFIFKRLQIDQLTVIPLPMPMGRVPYITDAIEKLPNNLQSFAFWILQKDLPDQTSQKLDAVDFIIDELNLTPPKLI